jgi:hypothetical protein
MQFGDRVLPGAEKVPSCAWYHPVTKLHKLCQADVRLRTPDDGQKDCPKKSTVVIPTKLELSASVGFIHKG